MVIGEVAPVTVGECSDIYFLDIGLYGCPCYGAIYILDTERPAVIETGTGVNIDLLMDALDSVGIGRDELEVIALTHVHLDHAGGAGLLASKCRKATVYVHPLGASHLVDPAELVAGTKRVIHELWEYHAQPTPIPEERIITIEGDSKIDLGDRKLSVVPVPGHAPHQVAFYDRENGALFTGDSAGMWLPAGELLTVTTPPPNFDLEKWLASHDKIREVDPGLLMYTHFGPRVADDAIEDHERILKQWVTDIDALRQELDDGEIIERCLDSSDLRALMGDPAGSIPTQFSVEGVLVYLDSQL